MQIHDWNAVVTVREGGFREALEARGTPARIDFSDPDAILAVETVGQRAGLSLWSREVIARHPLPGLD